MDTIQEIKFFCKYLTFITEKLDQIDNGSEEAWSDIKEGVDTAWQSLNEAIKKVRSHFD